ncbi:MAG: hypothetical protein IT233_04950 [Bacteroidia bacterium]|nr:hypothetical protein [Bacteroidia bacterium]
MNLSRSSHLKFILPLIAVLGLEVTYLVKDRYFNFNPVAGTPDTYEKTADLRYRKWLASEQKKTNKPVEPVKFRLESSYIRNGQIWLYYIDSTIQHGIHNFPHHSNLRLNAYGALYAVYLPEEVCKALSLAQQELKREYPYYNLIVLDGTRAAHIDSATYDTCHKLSTGKAGHYIHGNPHHYGSAVDMGIVNEKGVFQSMGLPYNIFEEYGMKDPYRKDTLGPIQRELANRELLRKVMTKAGFRPSALNYWHFEYGTPGSWKEKFRIIP